MKRKRLWILFGILLVVGGALSLLLVLPARAIITSTTHTTVADFNLGTFYHTGLARQDDGEVTLLAIGIAGEWIRPTVSGLPPVFGHATVQHNGYVYVIGGRLAGNVLTRSVYFAHIDPVTYQLEPFQATTPLPASAYPEGVYMLAATVVGNYLYVVGGATDVALHQPTTTVLFAPFNPDGTLGDWQSTTSLPAVRARTPAVTLNGYIYLIGGQHGAGDTATDETLYAQPDPTTGHIAQWQTATSFFPYPTFGHMATAYEGQIYVLGGYDISEGKVQAFVHYATPSTTTGNITTWEETIPLPNNSLGGAAVAFNGELFALGGIEQYPSPGTPADYARAALLDITSGQIITYATGQGWYESPALSPGRAWHGVVLDPGHQYLYILGGTNDKTNPIVDGLLNRGATTGLGGAGYARSGWYLGPLIELERDRKILNFNWTAILLTNTTLTMQYHKQLPGQDWEPWSAPIATTGTLGVPITTTVTFTEQTAFRFQYKALFSTQNISYTPILQRVELKYDVPLPPEFRKEAQPPSYSSVLPGDLITYTLRFTNVNDLSPLRQVVLTDVLPLFMTYISGSLQTSPGITMTYNPTRREFYCEIQALSPRAGGWARFVAQVNSDAPMGAWLINQARFQSYDLDRPQDRTTAHYIQSYTPEIFKEAYPPNGASILPGSQIAYTVTFTNTNEASPLTNVIISDTPSCDLNLCLYKCSPDCTINNNAVIWHMDTLSPTQVGHVWFELYLDDSTPDGTLIQNTAALRSNEAIAFGNTTQHTVRVPHDLQIGKSDGQRTAVAGQTLTYTIAYTHHVAAGRVITLTNVIITDDLLTPGWVTLTSGTAGWTVISPTRWTYHVGTLGPGQSGRLTVVAKIASVLPVTSVLSVRNQATIGHDGLHGLEQDPSNNQSIDSNVLAGPDLVLRNVQKPARIFKNIPFQIRFEIANEGLAEARAWDDDNNPAQQWLAAELYARPAGFTPSGPPAGPKDHAGGWCAVAQSPCPGNQQRYSYLAFIQPPDYPLGAGQARQRVIATTLDQLTVYSLYLQVDVANPEDPDYGRILEADEHNNIIFLGTVLVEPIKVYLPIVLKNK